MCMKHDVVRSELDLQFMEYQSGGMESWDQDIMCMNIFIPVYH